MKITASKLEDIRREKAAWDADLEQKRAAYNEEQSRYRQAQEDVFEPVRQYVEEMIASPLLEFEIRVDEGSFRNPGLEIRIDCNERKKFEDSSALSWNFRVNLDSNGQVVKESGSWSGLKATTPEQINSLKATVEALEALNAVDWAEVLNKELPDYKDYIKTVIPRNRPDFESQEKVAELEEYVGKPIAFKGSGIESLGGNRRYKAVWYIIHRETPKKYVVSLFTDYDIHRYDLDNASPQEVIEAFKDRSAYQVKKEYLLEALQYPFVTLG